MYGQGPKENSLQFVVTDCAVCGKQTDVNKKRYLNIRLFFSSSLQTTTTTSLVMDQLCVCLYGIHVYVNMSICLYACIMCVFICQFLPLSAYMYLFYHYVLILVCIAVLISALYRGGIETKESSIIENDFVCFS